MTNGGRFLRRALVCAVALAAALPASQAAAGGLFFSDRGVRPMGRGGAFVAGADDLGAIFYNPAGLVDAGNQVLVDASWMLFHSSYTRMARVRQYDPDTGEPTGQAWDQTFPTVKGTSQILPIPTLAISNNFGLERAMFVLGMYSPYAAGSRYPETVAGQPNPGRFMLLNLDGSALVIPGVWAAYAPTSWLSAGAGFQALIGNYKTRSMMTTCLPDRFVCAPEQEDFDATTQMSVGPIFAPGANFGVTLKPWKYLRIGTSYQTPFRIESDATVHARLPSSAFFDNAQQVGDKATVRMAFPSIFRVGVEARELLPRTRAEVAWVYEAWSIHDRIHVTPQNIYLNGVELFPPVYKVGDVSVPRNFRDTWSLRLGAEHWEKIGPRYQLDTRIGVMYEKSAIPTPYLTTLTIDLDKVIVGLGGSLHINKTWRFDALFAHVFGFSQTVSTTEAAHQPINPVKSNPAEYPIYVNAGKYSASANIIGVGMAVNYM